MNSKLHIGEPAVVNFGVAGLFHGTVAAVKFASGQVYYDIEVHPFHEEPENKHITTLLRDVRGYFVEKATDRFHGRSNMGMATTYN
jgi:hypothetical protein